MTATEILNELERRGVQLEAHGDRLRFRPREAVTQDLVEILRQRKGEILETLRRTRVPARVRGQDRITETTAPERCWHCKGQRVCGCALCAVRGPVLT